MTILKSQKGDDNLLVRLYKEGKYYVVRDYINNNMIAERKFKSKKKAVIRYERIVREF